MAANGEQPAAVKSVTAVDGSVVVRGTVKLDGGSLAFPFFMKTTSTDVDGLSGTIRIANATARFTLAKADGDADGAADGVATDDGAAEGASNGAYAADGEGSGLGCGGERSAALGERPDTAAAIASSASCASACSTRASVRRQCAQQRK